MLNSFQVSSGNKRVPVTYRHEARTEEQFKTVQGIIKSEEFDFTCLSDNPFDKEIGDYVGPFNFLFYTKRGQLKLIRISKRGTILKRCG